MPNESERKPWQHPHPVQTIIHDLERSEQIAWLDGPVWFNEGAVIELGNPNRDAIVLGSRLQLATPGNGDLATIIVDVSVGDPGNFVPRHPLDRERPQE